MSGSLFERLTMGGQAEELAEDESIRLHISRMLTTRQGSVQTLPDYGLPDLNDLHYSKSDLMVQCCLLITESIRKYEPRLTDISVNPLPGNYGDFTMAFSISAHRISPDGALLPWRWSVNLDGGKFTSN